jgi:hypothetical protein
LQYRVIGNGTEHLLAGCLEFVTPIEFHLTLPLAQNSFVTLCHFPL